jgi:hypothetical protein
MGNEQLTEPGRSSAVVASLQPPEIGTMSARMRIVEEHVTWENEHNLDGIMDTFGETARYDDEGWGAH